MPAVKFRTKLGFNQHHPIMTQEQSVFSKIMTVFAAEEIILQHNVLSFPVDAYLDDNLNLKNPNKNMALANLSIYYTWKNIKSEYNNNKFKISAPTWNDEFNLPDGSNSVSDIQDYFEYIIKKHETITDKPPV